MKTNALRKLIEAELGSIGKTYYKQAPKDKMYPHIVYELINVDLGDLSRDDYKLSVDVWCKANQPLAEDLSDAIVDKFNGLNLPSDSVLPTFFRADRQSVPDEDKSINHINLSFQVQSYERS